jgi:hypothetical protein
MLEKIAYRKRHTKAMSQINGLQGREVLCSSRGLSKFDSHRLCLKVQHDGLLLSRGL